MPKGIPKAGHRASRSRHKDGKLVRPYKVTSRINASPAKFYIGHGGDSRILKARLDGRSLLGKQYREALKALKAHIGDDPTAPQIQLIDQAARLCVLANLSWAEILKSEGIVKDDRPHPAIDVFLKTAKNQRDVLNLLGIERPVKQISLSAYLAEAGKEAA